MVSETFANFAGAEVKILPLVPAPPPLVVGVAYLKKKALPMTIRNFITAAKRASPRSGA